MIFYLFSMFALLLVLLTGTAATVCDGTDMCWSELGDDTAIGDAFGEVCSHMRHDANCDAGCQLFGCTSVGENHIFAMVKFDKKPSNISVPCEQLLGQLKEDCPKGGSNGFEASGFDAFKWTTIHGNITVHPKADKCDGEA